MPEIKGRTGDRKSAWLEVVDEEILVSIATGFLGRNRSTQVIPFDEVTHVESRIEEKPYPDALALYLDYHGGELRFFSINKEPLMEVTSMISNYLWEKAEYLKESMELFMSNRESNVPLIMFNMELFEALMRLIAELEGSVNWDRVEELLIQVEIIIKDKLSVQNLNPSSLSVGVLRGGVERRRPQVVKEEVYDLLSMLSFDAESRSQQSIPWFPQALHGLFSQAMMTLWNQWLGPVTGVDPVFMGEDAQEVFDVLRNKVVEYTELDDLPTLNIGESGFSLNRDTLFKWVEALEMAEFRLELGD